MSGDMDSRYTRVSKPPQDALKTIDYGKLKGKSDINPQWRWEALTEIYGLCGLGWKFDVVDCVMQDVQQTGEKMLFIRVNLYVKDGENWSDPVPGYGGDFLIVKDKNGYHGNDEAFKMALTDALGSAAKMIGVASAIYRGLYDTKYQRYMDSSNNAAQTQTQAQKAAPAMETSVKETLLEVLRMAQNEGISKETLGAIVNWKYRKASRDLTFVESLDLKKNLLLYHGDMLREKAEQAA